MNDKILRIDPQRNKMVVLVQKEKTDGSIVEEEMEIDIPAPATTEGMIRKIKYDEEGKMYETEEKISIPVFDETDK